MIEDFPNPLVLCPGDSGSLNLLLKRVDDESLQWRKNGEPIIGATQPQYQIVRNAQGEGVYNCVLSHCSGEVLSTSVTVRFGERAWTDSVAADWLSPPENPCNDLNGNGFLDLLDLVALINEADP